MLLHLGYDGWWEQDMQEISLKRMSDAKVSIQCLLPTNGFWFVYTNMNTACRDPKAQYVDT